MSTKLPSELEDEILFRVPPLSLTRFRTVCKRWNTLFNDQRFINNHLACVRPQFILRTEKDSKIYSIGINLDDSLEVRELNLETQGPKKLKVYRNLFYCDGFLLCPALIDEVAVWNPWLRQQTKWIEPKRTRFNLSGLGYDNRRPEKCYKILGFSYGYSSDIDGSNTKINPRVSIYEFETNMWKDLKFGLLDWHLRSPRTVLSLNGTLYWIAMRCESGGDCFIQSFDFSRERFEPFCLLPCKNDLGDTQILEVFRGDRFTLLEQCVTTKKIKIWVTKNRISGDRKELVSWRLLMTVSIPNFPRLQDHIYSKSQPSYFMDNNDDKRLIVCTCDEIGKPCIYIVKGDRFKKIQMDFEVDPWPFHLVYVPSLVPIPLAQEQQ